MDFVRRREVVTREIDGETILVPICRRVGELDCIYTLNGPGAMIWSLLEGRGSVDQIARAVCEAFEVSPETARRDVRELLRDLEEAGLVRGGVQEKENGEDP